LSRRASSKSDAWTTRKNPSHRTGFAKTQRRPRGEAPSAGDADVDHAHT
jgi:hypothetical protein